MAHLSTPPLPTDRPASKRPPGGHEAPGALGPNGGPRGELHCAVLRASQEQDMFLVLYFFSGMFVGGVYLGFFCLLKQFL